jgi:hypothetical protein
MNGKTTVLLTSLAATMAVSMIIAPAAFAATYLGIDGFDVQTKDNNDNTRIKVNIDVGANVPLDGSGGAFGYAVFTGGFNNVLVLVTHLGIDDSEHEDPVSGFHTHVLDLMGPTSACADADAEVDLANSVANKGFDLDSNYSINGDKISVGYTPTSLLGGSTVTAVHSFTVEPVFDGSDNLTNLCVTVTG